MPTLSNSDAIKEYYETVKDSYPNLSFKHFEEICGTPFRFVKMCMRSVETYCISIKYFGKFRVHSSKIKRLINKLEYRLRQGFIEGEYYEQKMAVKKEQLKNVLVYESKNGVEKTD